MTYEKRTWVDGKTPINADNMNHIEEGIAANSDAIKAVNNGLAANINVANGANSKSESALAASNAAIQFVNQVSAAKLDKAQGAENAGKVLVVDGDGALGMPERTWNDDFFPVVQKNLIDMTAITRGGWCYNQFQYYDPVTGEHPYLENYCHTDYIPVIGGEKYVLSGNAFDAHGCFLHSYAYLDSGRNIVSSTIVDGYNEGNDYYVFDVPENASYIIINDPVFSRFVGLPVQLEKGEIPTEYAPYASGTDAEKFYLPKLTVKKKQIEDLEETVNLLRMPEAYHLVVGDTFELFYKGIINAVNPDLFDVVVTCGRGAVFTKRFIFTPTSEDVGTHALTIELYDYHRECVGQQTVSLIVSEKAVSPAENINLLCVGDSLTSGGAWPGEFMRRLTETDGTPAGDGLTNITSIGTRGYGNRKYEGYGGWQFTNYNTENVSNNAKIITCTHDKTAESDQHSLYKDSNGAIWKLETIESGSIKILAVDGDWSSFPETGTLTWVSGGTNNSDIVYTASENGAGNPFWDDEAGAVDFAKYAESVGAASIDYVYVLLGWNNADTDTDTYTQGAQTFIDNVHKAFPDCKIILMGLQIPARDGLGNNYGARGTYSRYYDLMQHVFRLDTIYAGLSESNDNVYSFNLSGQFDTEHNHITAERPVNVRNSMTETYQSNGVHPAAYTGAMQIADAAYRDLVYRLQLTSGGSGGEVEP